MVLSPLLQLNVYQLSIADGSLPCLSFPLISFTSPKLSWAGSCPEATTAFISFGTRIFFEFVFDYLVFVCLFVCFLFFSFLSTGPGSSITFPGTTFFPHSAYFVFLPGPLAPLHCRSV
ncbi:mCG147113 [Mus musculus]|nr:mCG147113 [Mus musculus]